MKNLLILFLFLLLFNTDVFSQNVSAVSDAPKTFSKELSVISVKSKTKPVNSNVGERAVFTKELQVIHVPGSGKLPDGNRQQYYFGKELEKKHISLAATEPGNNK